MADRQRVALVTGAARGIGMAISEPFAAQGCAVVVSDVDGAEATSVAERLDPSGARTLALELDVTSSASADAAVAAAVAGFGRLDALVNVAGTINPQASHEVPDADWSALLSVHLDGTFRCSRAAYPALAAADSAVIASISWLAAKVGIPERLSSAAA